MIEGDVLLDAAGIAERVEIAADKLAPLIDDETVCVCLLTGGIWFAADLLRALSRRGINPLFDGMWLGSYGDERETSGRVVVRAGLQREVAGRKVLLIDDVFDSGLSMLAAEKVVRDAGAAKVLTAVFASKPWPKERLMTPDVIAWEAPARFLVGYGMDDAGRMRGLPDILALEG